MCVILFCPSLHKRVLLQEECPEKGRCLVADVPQYFVPMLKNFSDSTLLNIFVLFQFVHLFVHFCNSFNSSFVYSLKGASFSPSLYRQIQWGWRCLYILALYTPNTVGFGAQASPVLQHPLPLPNARVMQASICSCSSLSNERG